MFRDVEMFLSAYVFSFSAKLRLCFATQSLALNRGNVLCYETCFCLATEYGYNSMNVIKS